MSVSPTLPKALVNLLRVVDRRLRLHESVRSGLVALSVGLFTTLLLLALGRFYPLTFPWILLAAGLGLTLLGLLGVLAFVWLRPRPLLAVARLVDRHTNLDERLSTALELAADNARTPARVAQGQLADTLNHLKQVNPVLAFPFQWPWPWLATGGILATAIVVTMLLPNPQLQVLNRRAKTQEEIAKQKTFFEEVRADLLDDESFLETPQAEPALETLDELLETLEEKNLSLEEAMAAVSEAEQELAALQEMNEQQEASLNDLAQTFSQFESTAELAEALEQRDMAGVAEAMASAGNNLAADPETAQDLASALQEAAQTAQEAGDTELAEALRQAAESLSQAAGQAAEGGDPQAMQEALQQAAEALAEAGEQLAGQEALEQALANIQQAQEQLAESNGQGPSGPGQPFNQGPGQGGELVEGEGTGGGAGREDPGEGAEGLTAEEGTSNQMSTDNGPNEGRTREYESLYAPLHLGGEGGPLVKPEEQGAEGGIPTGLEAPVDPDRDPGEALVPYDRVYGEYSEAASQALDNSYIPLGMKGYVRQYFGALEPGQ